MILEPFSKRLRLKSLKDTHTLALADRGSGDGGGVDAAVSEVSESDDSLSASDPE